jgi:hypothetical protein
MHITVYIYIYINIINPYPSVGLRIICVPRSQIFIILPTSKYVNCLVTYIQIYISKCAYLSLNISVYIYLYIYVYLYICIYIYMHTYIFYIHTYIHIYTYLYLYVYINIHRYLLNFHLVSTLQKPLSIDKEKMKQKYKHINT